jgi:hypothetical protein
MGASSEAVGFIYRVSASHQRGVSCLTIVDPSKVRKNSYHQNCQKQQDKKKRWFKLI